MPRHPYGGQVNFASASSTVDKCTNCSNTCCFTGSISTATASAAADYSATASFLSCS